MKYSNLQFNCLAGGSDGGKAKYIIPIPTIGTERYNKHQQQQEHFCSTRSQDIFLTS